MSRNVATPWEPLASGLFALLQRIGVRRDIERAERDQALVTILTAANETRGYLRATHAGKPRDVQREHALSNLWDICGVTIRRFDNDLARRCELKGQFWRDPEEWTTKDINAARPRTTRKDDFKPRSDVIRLS